MSTFYTDKEEDVILRDQLATDRTRLANQRTLLSFIRTGLYFGVSAVALWQVKSLAEIQWLAFPLVILAIVTMISGVINYIMVNNRMKHMPKTRIKNESKS